MEKATSGKGAMVRAAEKQERDSTVEKRQTEREFVAELVSGQDLKSGDWCLAAAGQNTLRSFAMQKHFIALPHRA
jgi:nicotinamide riboside kinase